MSDDGSWLERFVQRALKRFNPDFSTGLDAQALGVPRAVRTAHPVVNHSRNIPDLRTPIPGLYLASMSQVYPWDRGTNYAVQIGRQAAARLLADMTVHQILREQAA